MSDANPVNQEVEGFNKDNLKKTKTEVRVFNPTKKDMDEDKKAEQEGQK